MFFDLLASGIALGSIYGLVAPRHGRRVQGGAGAVNFAHGEIFATAAFVGYLLTANGLDYWGALTLAVLVTTVLGILIERGAYRPLANASDLALIIATIAGLVHDQGRRPDLVRSPRRLRRLPADLLVRAPHHPGGVHPAPAPSCSAGWRWCA